jgi:hypothetical protein
MDTDIYHEYIKILMESDQKVDYYERIGAFIGKFTGSN